MNYYFAPMEGVTGYIYRNAYQKYFGSVDKYYTPFIAANKGTKLKSKEIKDILANSIKYHQITSDVEVGSYLSGGVDSSYVVSVAKPDKTFSVGFDEAGFDETKMAQEFSELMKVKNYSKYIFCLPLLTKTKIPLLCLSHTSTKGFILSLPRKGVTVRKSTSKAGTSEPSIASTVPRCPSA